MLLYTSVETAAPPPAAACPTAQGVIRQDGTGFATFKVQYLAAVCRPYKGEVIDCVVTSVNKVRRGRRFAGGHSPSCTYTGSGGSSRSSSRY